LRKLRSCTVHNLTTLVAIWVCSVAVTFMIYPRHATADNVGLDGGDQNDDPYSGDCCGIIDGCPLSCRNHEALPGHTSKLKSYDTILPEPYSGCRHSTAEVDDGKQCTSGDNFVKCAIYCYYSKPGCKDQYAYAYRTELSCTKDSDYCYELV
jgi:hypothetical protein